MFSPQNFKKRKLSLYPKLEITKARMVIDQSHYCRFYLNFWKDMFIYKHLVTYLETLYLFHPLQSGFRRKHSCNTAFARLTDSSLSAINRSDLSGDVFLDLKKHSILLITESYSQKSTTCLYPWLLLVRRNC